MRSLKSLRQQVSRVTSGVYRHSLRKLIPISDAVQYAGISIDIDRKFGDRRLVPGHFHECLVDRPRYEHSLVNGLGMYVKPGMNVVVIGGGIGVTAVIAAKLVGPRGKVTCYEASLINVSRIKEVAKRNGVSFQLDVVYGLVGPAIGVYHMDRAAPQIKMEDLPDCDLLEMDCEGSEKYIIENLRSFPKNILVETHGSCGAPTEEISHLLSYKGYQVTDMGLAEPDFELFCSRNDIRVLGAVFKEKNIN